MRRRLLPSPPISLLLFFTWLMLSASLSAGHLLLAAVFAVAVPWFTERLRPEKARLRQPFVAARLAAVVLRDIVLSNIEVARRILGPESAIQPRFVWLPLTLRDPHALVALAGIITLTPGTLSAEISADRRHLLIHAFNVEDEAALIRDIQTRYEAPLRQIFE
jgi:multicomponent K+:H+ antiporter subunit E